MDPSHWPTFLASWGQCTKLQAASTTWPMYTGLLQPSLLTHFLTANMGHKSQLDIFSASQWCSFELFA